MCGVVSFFWRQLQDEVSGNQHHSHYSGRTWKMLEVDYLIVSIGLKNLYTESVIFIYF